MTHFDIKIITYAQLFTYSTATEIVANKNTLAVMSILAWESKNMPHLMVLYLESVYLYIHWNGNWVLLGMIKR